MDLLILLIPIALLIAILITLAILGERSINRQKNPELRRGEKERGAAGHFLEKWFRW